MLSITLAAALATVAHAQYTYPGSLPDTTQSGQSGTNNCDRFGASSQDSTCQNAFINSVNDFCFWAPPSTTSAYGNSAIGNVEREVVSWCLQPGYGTRLIPDGTISAAHFVITPSYVQVTGGGDMTKVNIPLGDDGGELDPHGADGNGNPVGGLVFSKAFTGQYQQITEWTNFMGAGYFCFKACIGSNAAAECQHIYDVLGCGFNVPGDYSNSFDDCKGDSIEPQGVYGASTFHQGDPTTPTAHAPAATSQCTPYSSIGNGLNAAAIAATMSAPQASSSVMASSAAMSSVMSSAMASASGSASSAAMASGSVMSSMSMGASASSVARSSAARSSAAISSARASGSAAVAAASASASNAASGGVSSISLVGWSAVVGVVGALGGALLL